VNAPEARLRAPSVGAAPAPAVPIRRPSLSVAGSQRRSRPTGAAPPEGAHVRLGVAWALLTVAATAAGPAWVALWMAPTAALAAGSAWRRPGADLERRRGLDGAWVAMAAAGVVTLVSAAGLVATVGAAAVTAVTVGAWAAARPGRGPGPARAVLTSLLPAAAASGLVLSRAHGQTAGLVLVAVVCGYDAMAYLMGSGPDAWDGIIAGVAWIVALTLLVAAVLVPPFAGARASVLGATAAVLAPLGPVVARRLTGAGPSPAPALRRLDSLLLLGPAWALGAAILLRP
jgi:hypothetical protein